MPRNKINPSPKDLSDNEYTVQRYVEQYIYDHHKLYLSVSSSPGSYRPHRAHLAKIR